MFAAARSTSKNNPLVRQLSSALPRAAGDVKKNRTRRKPEELPKVFLSPTGEPVAPLKDWDGGLTGRSNGSAATAPKAKKVRATRKAKESSGTDDVTTEPELARPTSELAVGIFENLARFPHCLLLTRVGQFYESYFDQAIEISNLLLIKLTSKAWGGGRVPMCGFPLTQLDRHLKMLIRSHQRCVALCEEFRQPDGSFKRRVTRVLTPGTLIDEAFVNPYENNYVLSVSHLRDTSDLDLPIGLAWMDVSTGELFSQVTNLGSLRDEVVRIGPKEIVLDAKLQKDEHHPILVQLAEDTTVFRSFVLSEDDASLPTMAAEIPSSDNLTKVGKILPTYEAEEASAISQLTKFLKDNLLEHMPTLSQPLRQGTEDRMQIDAHSVKSLEIKESMREGGTAGTLLSAVNRTSTTSGSRLLSRWIHAPSTSVSEITTRQDIVAFFVARPHLRMDLIAILKKIEDAARIVQKFMAGRGAPDDLKSLGEAISHWETFRNRLTLERKMEALEQGQLHSWGCMVSLLSNMVPLKELGEKISSAILLQEEVDAPVETTEDDGTFLDPMIATSASKQAPSTSYKWSIKPDFSPPLRRLHTKLEQLQREREELQIFYQSKLYANSLTLRAGTHLGYHVHVRKRDASKLDNDVKFVALTESGSTKTFFNEAWSKLGSNISETAEQIVEEERAAFLELREEVTRQSSKLRKTARIIDELDVTIGFAELAVAMNFTRPVITDDLKYYVVNGRHPTVELGLQRNGRTFVPNTVCLDPSTQLNVITGPNMAGKSTLLRQTALIALLAQTGSFVPADHAQIGIVDRLFSRVGAKDDLYRDRSTFYVEMLECGEILNRATPRSLVIMDEVGRGTSVSTAISLAFASIQHLYNENKSRALFATHFHEIADILGYDAATHRATGHFNRVGFFCTDVDETKEGGFTYSHRLRQGVNRDSHGLKVAQLANMPRSAIKIAEKALEYLLGEERTTWVARAEELRALGERLSSAEAKK